MNVGRKILIPLQTALYAALLFCGILCITGHAVFWDYNQAKIIIIASCSAFLGVYGPLLVEKIFRIHLSFLVDLIIALDMFGAIVLGESLQVYRQLHGYDKFMHFSGAFQLTIAGYAIFYFFLSSTNKGKYQMVFALLFGFFFGVCCECLWELYEYTFDYFSNVDMQKYRPDEFTDHIDDNGNIILLPNENGVDPKAIVEYYSTKAGMEFALHDTMMDIVADALGGVASVIFCSLLFKWKPELQSRLVYRDNPEMEAEETEVDETKTMHTDKKQE